MATRLLVSTRKGLFTVDRSASGWKVTRERFFGDHVVIAAHDPRDGAIYAALNHGHFGNKLHRSDDAGETFIEIATPAYPPMPEGEQEVAHPFTGKVIPWKLRMIWSIEPGAASQPGRLWCGTLPGGLFISNDHGQTWSLVDDLWRRPERKEWFGGGFDEAGIHSICIDPRNPAHVIVGISCGGAWRTENDGGNWTISAKGMRAEYMPPERAYEENSQDPHIVVRCAGQPDKLWSQHHNGIFRTVDNARTWTEVTGVQPSVFGFACAVHPTNGDIAWFVPAQKDEKRVPVRGQVVVTRTTDGGRSFDTLRKGLPQEFAYDLVFRHALDVDESGQRLAFGSTTGSLWTSEDGGDSWQTVSTHLPPIYAVRFIKE
ncbi:MAG: exo-alpha-sialidase [Phycisphaeraceae bacterium]|nr:MAG: exo-alpha-sialidase [Phycisphaeraceae bacterium]